MSLLLAAAAAGGRALTGGQIAPPEAPADEDSAIWRPAR
jgi:hypothetical protein